MNFFYFCKELNSINVSFKALKSIGIEQFQFSDQAKILNYVMMSKTQIWNFFRIFWKLVKISVFGILKDLNRCNNSFLNFRIYISSKI